jgi:hypothetical protein
MILWHGGRDLEYSFQKIIPSKSKRWEFGPGLYVTTHYETARKYAKGGGSVYKVEFDLGTNIKDINVPIDIVSNFVNSYVIGKHKKPILEDLHNNMKKRDTIGFVNAEVILNLMINYDAVSSKNTVALNKFLVDLGADYVIGDRFGGRNETIFCLLNKEKIKKVKKTTSKEVSVHEYEFEITEILEKNKTTKIKI